MLCAPCKAWREHTERSLRDSAHACLPSYFLTLLFPIRVKFVQALIAYHTVRLLSLSVIELLSIVLGLTMYFTRCLVWASVYLLSLDYAAARVPNQVRNAIILKIVLFNTCGSSIPSLSGSEFARTISTSRQFNQIHRARFSALHG